MAYSMEPVSDGCYPGTAVLVNKFDIRDDAKRKEVESVLVSARNAEWLNSPLQAAFDFEHYKAIHRFLFSGLYDWTEIDGDLLMIATNQAAQGVTDLLRQIFHAYIRSKPGG